MAIAALLQVLGYLLQHPVVALAAGGGAAFLVPRLVRAGVRFILVPAVLLLAAYIAFSNPSFVLTAVTGVASSAPPLPPLEPLPAKTPLTAKLQGVPYHRRLSGHTSTFRAEQRAFFQVVSIRRPAKKPSSHRDSLAVWLSR